MSKKIIKIFQEDSVLFVYWHLTDNCNYKCNYCPAFLNQGWFANGRYPGFPTQEELLKLIDKLELISKTKKIYIVLSGGEPTIHPMFDDILNRITKFSSVGIITNGSRSVEWWKKLKTLPDRITISLHPEFTKMEKIIDLSRYLLEHKVKLIYHLSADPNNWDKVKEMFETLDDSLKNHIIFKIITDLEKNQDRKVYEYSNDQLNYIKEHQNFNEELFENFETDTRVLYEDETSDICNVQNLILNQKNKFLNWKCSAGINGIKINVDGNVYAGICSIKKLGKITDFNLLDEYLNCDRSFCACPGDIRLTKFDPDYEKFK